MHARLISISKRLQHAQAFADSCGTDLAERFLPDHPYRICFIRLSNKARYAVEVVESYAHRMPSDGDLTTDQTERVIETEKWFLIGALSVVEYSMPSFLGNRGSAKLRSTAKNGPFSKFLAEAVAEKAIEENDKGLLEFLSKVRNSLVHRNGVSRENAKMIYRETTYELIKDEMIEGHWGMLAELGTLAIYSASSIMDCIEERLGAETA